MTTRTTAGYFALDCPDSPDAQLLLACNQLAVDAAKAGLIPQTQINLPKFCHGYGQRSPLLFDIYDYEDHAVIIGVTFPIQRNNDLPQLKRSYYLIERVGQTVTSHLLNQDVRSQALFNPARGTILSYYKKERNI
jgi:hypothetical protein